MATEKTLWICNAGAGILGLPPALVQDIPGYPDSELEKYVISLSPARKSCQTCCNCRRKDAGSL